MMSFPRTLGEGRMTSTTRYSTDDVAGQESFAYWRDLICDVFINLDCSTAQERSFGGRIQTQAMAEIEVSTMEADAMRLVRTKGHIARAGDDHFLIVLQGGGTMVSQQDGRESTLSEGDCALFDSARPYVASFERSFRHVVLKVSRGLMRSRYGPIEGFSGLRIPGDRGMGRVASRFLQSLPENLAHMSPASASRAAAVSLDLVAAAIADLSASAPASDTAVRVARRVQIKDYIESHLCDPELSLSSVAAGLQISARYVNDVFEGEDTSVVRHIWSRRLERCHALLRDPAQSARSIGSIAFGLGFNNMSHFSRCFRLRYGMSPSEYRAEATPR
jgi:AraC-like DNA-binding protein